MTKTMKLTGRALELAQAIGQLGQDTRQQIGTLREQADAISKAADAQAERLHSEIKAELELAEDDCCHLDMSYLQDHGLAFARTGCERRSGLGDLLQQLTGSRAPSSGGLH